MSLFNDDQISYMRHLDSIPPETKCWCGWYPLGECYNCGRDGALVGKTCADRIAQRCEECGNTPSSPGWAVYHSIKCSKIASKTVRPNPT